jgi:hypothetical protein
MDSIGLMTDACCAPRKRSLATILRCKSRAIPDRFAMAA